MRHLQRFTLSLTAGLAVTLALAAPAATDLNAQAQAPRTATASAGVPVTLTVHNPTSEQVTLTLSRDSKQNCTFGPLVRVLAVGTRDVVYPSGEPLFCTQEVKMETIPANGQAQLQRTLQLPAGDYMVEVWLTGLVGDDGERVKLAGKPQRVTVK